MCHTPTPSHMCDPREGSSRRLEEEETAEALETKPLLMSLQWYSLTSCQALYFYLKIWSSVKLLDILDMMKVFVVRHLFQYCLGGMDLKTFSFRFLVWLHLKLNLNFACVLVV